MSNTWKNQLKKKYDISEDTVQIIYENLITNGDRKTETKNFLRRYFADRAEVKDTYNYI